MFTVLFSFHDVDDGNPIWDDLRGGNRRPRTRSYCRRIARALIFESADYALVVDLSTGEVVCTYTPNNAPVAQRRGDGLCPIQYGNDHNNQLPDPH